MNNQERVEKLCVGVLGWTENYDYSLFDDIELHWWCDGEIKAELPPLDANLIAECLAKLTETEQALLVFHIPLSPEYTSSLSHWFGATLKEQADAIIKVKEKA